MTTASNPTPPLAYFEAGGSPWGSSRISRWLQCARSIERYGHAPPTTPPTKAMMEGVVAHLLLAHLLWTWPRTDRETVRRNRRLGFVRWSQAGLIAVDDPRTTKSYHARTYAELTPRECAEVSSVRDFLATATQGNAGRADVRRAEAEVLQSIIDSDAALRLAGARALHAFAAVQRERLRIVGIEEPMQSNRLVQFWVPQHGPGSDGDPAVRLWRRLPVTAIADFIAVTPDGGRVLVDLKTTSRWDLDGPLGANIAAAGEIQTAIHRVIAEDSGMGYRRVYVAPRPEGPSGALRAYWTEPTADAMQSWLLCGPIAAPVAPGYSGCKACPGVAACWPLDDDTDDDKGAEASQGVV